MTRKLKRKIDRAAPKAAPAAVDEGAVIERNAAFSAAINEWGAALLAGPTATSDAVAASAGDFVGQIWNLASGPGAVDDLVATLLRSPAPDPSGPKAAGPTKMEAVVRDLVVTRRERFAGESRLVEAVVVQHLAGRRFYLALPVGWDAELG